MPLGWSRFVIHASSWELGTPQDIPPRGAIATLVKRTTEVAVCGECAAKLAAALEGRG